MSVLADVLSWILLLGGAALVLLGGVGVLRFSDLFTRMHAASLTDTGGSILVMVGLALQAGFTLATVKLAAILLFLLFTGPTSSYALANAALLAGMGPRAKERADADKEGGR